MKTVTGTFQFPDGTPANGAILYLKLSQDAVAIGTSQIAPKVVAVTLTNTGQIPANTNIYANDELTPSGTVYIASVIASGGGLVYGPELLGIQGTSPVNLNSLIPTNVGGIVISYPNPVLQNPSAPQTITGQSLTLSPTAPLTIQSVTTLPAGGSIDGSSNFTGLSYLFSGNLADPVTTIATIYNKANVGPTLSGLSASLRAGNPPAEILRVTSVGTTFQNALFLGNVLLLSPVTPSIASGFGTSPSIVNNLGPMSFRINVGTGGSASSGVITLPTANNGWNCFVNNLTAAAANRADNTRHTASTASSITLQNQTTSTGAAVAWAASDILEVSCFPY